MPSTGDRARVTALADRFVAEYQKNFPISFGFSGLPVKRNDGVDINSPEDVARWHALMKGMAAELAAIKPEAFASRTGMGDLAVPRPRRSSRTRRRRVCRNELWSVSAIGWQAALPQIAGIQPVGTDEARAQALSRWRDFGPWIDREIANLKEGQRLGYSATEAAAKSTLGQLDQMLAQKPDESPLMDPATRDKTPAFAAEWKQVIEGTVWPAHHALSRLPPRRVSCRTRANRPRSRACRTGAQCYRALIFATTTVDADPDALFDARRRKSSASARWRWSSGASCSATR